MNKTNLVVFVCIALAFLGYAFLSVKNSHVIQKDILEEVTALYKRCSQQSSTDLITDCMYKGYKKIVNKNNFEAVVVATQDAYSPNDCHAPAHLVAKIAYQDGASFSDILNKCADKCGYGCLHGAFQSKFESNLGGFINNIDKFCSDIDEKNTGNLIACWHIVGHGVAEYYGTNIDKAIGQCAKLPQGLPAWHCLNGLVMEYTEPFPWTSYGFTFSPDFYLNLCSKMPLFYQRDCFGSAGYVVLKVKNDKNEAVAICNHIPNDLIMRKKCAAENGGTLALQHFGSTEIYAFCSKFTDLYLMNECVISAGMSLSTGGFEKTATELCGLLNANARIECFASIGSSVENSLGATERKNMCAGLSVPDAVSCAKIPSDPRSYLLPSYQKGI